ncbi:MAG: DUF1800 family protein, partial [Verrucomicrobiota bacterium]
NVEDVEGTIKLGTPTDVTFTSPWVAILTVSAESPTSQPVQDVEVVVEHLLPTEDETDLNFRLDLVTEDSGAVLHEIYVTDPIRWSGLTQRLRLTPSKCDGVRNTKRECCLEVSADGETCVGMGTEHDFDPKTVVTGYDPSTFLPTTQTIPSRSATNTNARQDVEDAVNILFNHPNTPPFISRQLIQFLVTSNPTPGYVQRVATVFADNGSGVRGDLEAVVKAILLDDEARDPLQHLGTPHFGKLREPTVRAMHLSRILNMGRHSNLRWWDWGTYKDQSLQDPMNSPSVFNYFRPDFRLFGDLASNGLDSPAFGIVDSYSSISFPNHLWTICNTGFKDGSGAVLSEDLSALESMASDIPGLLDHLSLLYCAGTLGAESRASISTVLGSEGNLTERARLAAYLVLNSPEGTCLK